MSGKKQARGAALAGSSEVLGAVLRISQYYGGSLIVLYNPGPRTRSIKILPTPKLGWMNARLQSMAVMKYSYVSHVSDWKKLNHSLSNAV